MSNKKTIRFRVAYFDSGAGPYTETVDNEAQEAAVENDRRFIEWATPWIEANVTDNDREET